MSEVEKQILEKVLEIKKILKDNNYSTEYLNICIMGEYINLNNRYYDEDKDTPIKLCITDSREEQ